MEKLNWHPIEKFDRLKNKLEVKEKDDKKTKALTTVSQADIDEVYGTSNGGTTVAKNPQIKPNKVSYRSASTLEVKL